MLALARRQNIASNARKELETLMAHGNLSLNQRTAAVDMEYRSSQDLEALKAEQPVLNEELRALSSALAKAEGAIADLRKLYDDGRLRVPLDGVISRVVANKAPSRAPEIQSSSCIARTDLSSAMFQMERPIELPWRPGANQGGIADDPRHHHARRACRPSASAGVPARLRAGGDPAVDLASSSRRARCPRPFSPRCRCVPQIGSAEPGSGSVRLHLQRARPANCI